MIRIKTFSGWDAQSDCETFLNGMGARSQTLIQFTFGPDPQEGWYGVILYLEPDEDLA